MEHHRHIQSSNFTSQQSLDEPSAFSRARQPLSDAAGNALLQTQTLAAIGFSHHDSKAIHHSPIDRPMYSCPTVPSQPSRQHLENTLELRRQSSRRHRHNRHCRNPIASSPHYQSYRDRQMRDGNADDQKWPEVLEDAFLNALLDIPRMGRRKFSMRGKPHGRNELIKEYLWIAYTQSLAPGQPRDPTMERTRKQVSSHIQVLKGFMKDHPAYERLFPKKTAPNNGFEDSFKDNPCLRALSEGRIWNGRSAYNAPEISNQMIVQSHGSMRPAVFFLIITPSSILDDVKDSRCTSDADFREMTEARVVHRYTRLHSQRRRENLENVPNWRQRFTNLERIYNSNGLNCEIIHMNVSLKLMRDHPPDGAELNTRMEISIPGGELRGCQWQTVTSLIKPQELYRNALLDPPMEHATFISEVLGETEAETRIKVPFPANAWAQAFTGLSHLQLAFEEHRKAQHFEAVPINSSKRSAREYVDQISMYQEVQSSSEPGNRFVRRAIILWTFHKARRGEEGTTTWRYIDPLPPRQMCMSPSPHPSHHASAAMSENFNSWADPRLHLQNHSILDPFVQGLAIPSNNVGLQSPLASQDHGLPNHHFDIPPENFSFISNAIDSEPTLVENEAAANIDNFLSNASVNLDGFDHNTNGWHMAHTESFDTYPAWTNNNLPPSASQLGWESDTKNHIWPQSSPSKQVTSIDNTYGKHDEEWDDVIVSPTKQDHNYIEQNMGQKLLPWIDHHTNANGEMKNGFPVAISLPDLNNGGLGNSTNVTEEIWNGEHGDFGL